MINLRTSDKVYKWIYQLPTIGNKVIILYSLIEKKQKSSIDLASKNFFLKNTCSIMLKLYLGVHYILFK